MTIDLTTAEGAEQLAGLVLERTTEFFAERHFCPMSFDIIVTRGDEECPAPPGEKVGVHTLLVEEIPTEQSKNGLNRMVREHIARYRGIGVIWTAEAWGVMADETIPARPGHLDEHPNRIELVLVVLEHIRVKARWKASITRDAAGHPTLGPFTKGGPAKATGGRFENLLHHRFS